MKYEHILSFIGMSPKQFNVVTVGGQYKNYGLVKLIINTFIIIM